MAETSSLTTTNNDDLKALVRTVPDYPIPGIQFRDVSTLLLDGEGFRATIDRIAALVDPAQVDLIAGIEARGFIVAAGLSYKLCKGKLMLRKSGKLPGATVGIDYALEYGTDRIEMHQGAVRPGQRVLLVDDLLATGGTALAGAALLRGEGAIVDQAAFVIDLPELGGAARLRDVGITPLSLITFEGH
ncbi:MULTISPECIES: adenine phosphoribosyltransferase [unclassified Sphingobium]|uniref:adenine phosphoribosyltransferase n=1 Tax=unclassified Sphingobium TaxID=2611147 RepID=UPI002225B070|nr:MULTISPECIES: adenine phosphoribosyltransferase [unclassified Sphingobium]MCW2412397.1 adenine phosphoribosyltransferase [Sphingobium sp. B8D3D]MCW2415306.1 adenine phosphoribosyltransferase [Sphingobium sp. B8D3A]